MQAYTIAPLKWVHRHVTDTATPLDGVAYYTQRTSLGFTAIAWSENNCKLLSVVGTEAEAKAACEAHWQDRIKQSLVPVTEQNKENA